MVHQISDFKVIVTKDKNIFVFFILIYTVENLDSVTASESEKIKPIIPHTMTGNVSPNFTSRWQNFPHSYFCIMKHVWIWVHLDIS